MSMNGKGNQLFSGATIPSNKHRGHRGRHFLDHLQDIPDRLALADDVIEVKFHLTLDAALMGFAFTGDYSSISASTKTTTAAEKANLTGLNLSESFGSLEELRIGTELSQR